MAFYALRLRPKEVSPLSHRGVYQPRQHPLVYRDRDQLQAKHMDLDVTKSTSETFN